MADRARGQEVNRTGLSEVFGVSLPTVDTWVRGGCPALQRAGKGQQWVFDTAAVAKWLRDRAVADATGEVQQDEAEIELRTKRAKMLAAELELAKSRAEVAPVKEFERVQAARWAMVRANCLNIPQRAALQLLGETDEATFKRKLRAEIVLALETAASAQLDASEDPSGEDDAE